MRRMKNASADAAAIKLLRQQQGYARVHQLYALGLSKDQVADRVRRGVFAREYYGVVGLAGTDSSLASKAMRAVMIAGEGAVASLWTAAALHRLEAPHDNQTHVVVLGSPRPDPVADVHVHRTRYLPPDHLVKVNRVPTTSIDRTIVDCSELLDHWAALAVLDSCSPSASTWRRINATAETMSNGRAGVRAIAAVTAPGGAERMRSALERLARDALRLHDVPDGEWNVPLADHRGLIREVDLYFRAAKLIVEFDGLRFHRGPGAQQRDRANDRRLQLAGSRVLRYTWKDVVYRADATVKQVAVALAAI